MDNNKKENQKMASASKYVEYNKDTGLFTWLPREGRKAWNTMHALKDAGRLSRNGYWRISVIDGDKYIYLYAHRLAWFMHYGSAPTGTIDHINGIKTDNRIDNLRDVPQRINSRNMKRFSNNTTGYPCVYYSERYKKYWAMSTINREKTYLGQFDSIEDAAKEVAAFQAMHGATERHGKP